MIQGCIYKDKFGNVISEKEWKHLLLDNDYRHLKQESIGKYWISTVWLPSPYGIYMNENFETIVFTDHGKPTSTYPQGSIGEEQDCYRYETLEEAIKGHEEIVNSLKDEE
jgi:hypothetical protein